MAGSRPSGDLVEEMPAPAAAAVAKGATKALGRMLAARAARGGKGGGGQGPGLAGGLILALVAVPCLMVVALVLLVGVLGGVQQKSCSPAGGGSLPGDFSGPGSLGGVGGTGISRPLVERVRASSQAGRRITPGQYNSTAYGPPWGGIQGAGIATSGGLPIRGGSPRWYMIAVDPAFIGHGSFVYLWPNPFGWKGPFLAADTGGAIKSRRIDFYDWRGRATQLRWGGRNVRASAKPIAAAGGGAPSAQNVSAPIEQGAGSAGCAAGAGGEAGSLSAPGPKGPVTLAPGADRAGTRTKQVLLDFLARVAGVANRRLIITTGTNHSQFSSSGNVSDHWSGMAADLGSVANKFPNGGGAGTTIAAAALRTAGIPEGRALSLAQSGGGHSVCYRGWRVQVIWRTGGHFDHDHIGLHRGCSSKGVQTFQI